MLVFKDWETDFKSAASADSATRPGVGGHVHRIVHTVQAGGYRASPMCTSGYATLPVHVIRTAVLVGR